MKNSQSEQPSKTFAFLYQYIIQELFSQICYANINYCVKPKFGNDEIHIAIWKKYEEYNQECFYEVHQEYVKNNKYYKKIGVFQSFYFGEIKTKATSQTSCFWIIDDNFSATNLLKFGN